MDKSKIRINTDTKGNYSMFGWGAFMSLILLCVKVYGVSIPWLVVLLPMLAPIALIALGLLFMLIVVAMVK